MVDLNTLNVEQIATDSVNYIQNNFIPSVFALDPGAIAIVGIAALILIAIIFKTSQILFTLVKKLFLLIIVGFSLFFFISTFGEKLLAEGFSGQLIIVGVVGISLGLVALVMALLSAHRHTKSAIAGSRSEVFEEKVAKEKKEPLQEGKTTFSASGFLDSMQNDRSILAVLSYVIIAQFGVFSSVTLAAPNSTTGMVLAAVFFIGAFIFIKSSYHNYLTGVKHLLIAAAFALVLSVVLGLYWAEIPQDILFSIEYFASPSMIAFATSIAVSLLMGSKE
ncbi:MAG: hypothetical protein ABID38_01050 [Candidatus Diapherotrites archaeon]